MIPGIRPTRSRNTTGRDDSQNAKRTGKGFETGTFCEEFNHGKNHPVSSAI